MTAPQSMDARSPVTSPAPDTDAEAAAGRVRAAGAPRSGRARPRAAAWHAGWALAVAGSAGVALVVLGALSPAALAALAIAAAPGLFGLVRPAGPLGRTAWRLWAWRLWAWAAAAGLAAGLTGGVSGPLSPLLLSPLLAAIAYGGLWREAVGPAFAAVVAVAVVQAGGRLPPSPQGAEALALGLIALATTLATGAGALIGLAAAEAVAPAQAPAPAADLTLAARLQAAEDARAAAEADARGKMRFLANVSHELRTPLNAIMGFSDIMRTRLFGELSPRYAEYAELIHESGGHLLDLINDVLDVSKIDADRYVLAREDFDAREAVTAALRILRQQADDAGVQLRGVLPPEPIEVDADRRALKQIVLNLVSNAMKFTPRGGSIAVSLSAAAGALELAVADTGVGIAPEDLDRLGRPYEQAGDAADRARGTGLGLSLVRAFARLHGGDMVLESRLGEGTAVTVRLPVLAGAAPPGDGDGSDRLGPLHP